MEVVPQASALDPLDALAAQHGAGPFVEPTPAAGQPSVDPLDALAQQHGATVPTFQTSNLKDASGNATVDPNTIGTFLSHLVTQANPIEALRTIGKAMIPEGVARRIADFDVKTFGSKPLSEGEASTFGPLNAISHVSAAQASLYDKAKTAFQRGDYTAAARHFVNYLIPLAGPGIDKSGDLFQAGKWAAGSGDALGIGLATFAPQAIAKGLAPDARAVLEASDRPALAPASSPGLMTPANPADAAAVRFGQARGIPIDAATRTGNSFVRGAQTLVDKSIGGSEIAKRATQSQADALGRVGGELADQARGVAVTPDQAGQAIRDALVSKVQAHTDLATASYGKLRDFEAQPTNRLDIKTTVAAVDALPDSVRGQLRRIVHEMDASGYTSRTWNDVSGDVGKRGNASGGDAQIVAGAAGAKVFDDITARLERTTNPTRGTVQASIEKYLAGGPGDSDVVRAALQVATERGKARGGTTVSRPELPPSAMDVPTRLEASRLSTEDIGLPVNLKTVKMLLEPVYNQMTRQLPITQQQANPGLKAIQNLLEGPDWAPLSQADRDLSAIKALAREQGGLAKMAVGKLDAAVTEAAGHGGPHVFQALQQGRRATAAKYATQDLIDALPGGKLEEPVAVFKRATAPQDGGIEFLRAVKEHAPQTLPQIARAKLDELLAQATERGGFDHANKLYADWQKLGPETKRLLFPQVGQSQALGHFFLLAKKLAENPNPSGSAILGSQAAQLSTIGWFHPLAQITAQVGAAGLSAMLHAPGGAQTLTRALHVAAQGDQVTTAARAATAAELVQLARTAGVSLTLPAAAATQPTGNTPR